MAKKPLSVDDIFDQLHGSSNSSLAFTGLIDRVADDDQSISFARASHDQDWVTIPTSMIEKVQLIQNVRSKDRSHPLVHLVMKQPQTEEGRAFAALAHLHRPMAQLASLSTEMLFEQPPVCPPGQVAVRTNDGWICVPGGRRGVAA